jgi:hypothetical protein
MMLYAGHKAIGEIRDGGPGEVAAVYLTNDWANPSSVEARKKSTVRRQC